MKTLNEEIREIVASQATKAAKAAALKKLCITPYEISILLDSQEAAGPAPVRYSFTFGVEIECGVSRTSLMQAASQTGMPYEYQGYNHRDGHDFFKLVSDGSLVIPDAIECVSPVLKGARGKAALKNACKTLRMAGATVNRTCGLHVHIGAAGITAKQYVNTFVNYMRLEALVDSFMAPSRRADNNGFCHTLQNHGGLQSCNSVDEVQRELGYNRYHKVNPMSWDVHHTIEFRQHQGTTDYDKILNWALFCGKLVCWSKQNRLDHDLTSIDEVPFLTATEKAFFKGRAQACSAAQASHVII